MTIPLWLQRLGARVFPSIFMAPDNDYLATMPPLVHPDRPVRIDGVMYFARGDRTDAEFRSFIKKTMAHDDPPTTKREWVPRPGSVDKRAS